MLRPSTCSIVRPFRSSAFSSFRFLPAQRQYSSTANLNLGFNFSPRVQNIGTKHARKAQSVSHVAYPTRPSSRLYQITGIAALGLGLGLTEIISKGPIQCEPMPSATPPQGPPQSEDATVLPPPESSVNLLELSFGTVCGICAGVFVKKGAKAIAFVLGGVFVILQYLGSLSVLRIDWEAMSARFENLFYSKDAQGVSRPPNVGSLFRWLIDFLTADFQQRASFVVGFALGLRIG